MSTPRVFGLEVAWSPKLDDRTSVTPVLELLDRIGKVRYIHEKVYTRGEFEFLLAKWPQGQYADYSIGYLNGHSDRGSLWFPSGPRMSLEEIADLLEGQLDGKIVYFGGCSVFRIAERRLNDFHRRTGARAIAGFRKSVDWFEAAAFETLFMRSLTERVRVDAVDRHLRASTGSLYDRLGFQLRYQRPSRS